jgi:hypothetical protein
LGVHEAIHDPGLGDRQHGDVGRAQQLGQMPGRFAPAGPANQRQPGSPRQPGTQAGLRLVEPDEHDGSRGKAPPRRRGIGGDVHVGAGRRGESEQVVE